MSVKKTMKLEVAKVWDLANWPASAGAMAQGQCLYDSIEADIGLWELRLYPHGKLNGSSQVGL